MINPLHHAALLHDQKMPSLLGEAEPYSEIWIRDDREDPSRETGYSSGAYRWSSVDGQGKS